MIHPLPCEDGVKVELSCAPASDHVIVMRRTEAACQLGFRLATYPIEYDDEQLVEIAKNTEEKFPFGTSNTFYKLYTTTQGAAFYFENQEEDAKLVVKFQLRLENLYIKGEEEGVTSFSFELMPGENHSKILSPIVKDDSTSIEIRFDYDLEEL